MATMLLLAGLCGTATALIGMASRSVRDIDVLLPDLDTAADTAAGTAENTPGATTGGEPEAATAAAD
jgi:hypothetical protein